MAGETPIKDILHAQMGIKTREFVLKGNAKNAPKAEIPKTILDQADKLETMDLTKNPNRWKDLLRENEEYHPDTSGKTLRTTQTYSAEQQKHLMTALHQEKFISDTDLIDSATRYQNVQKTEALVHDLQGDVFTSPRKDEIISHLTKLYAQTKAGADLLESNPSGDLKPIVEEMLREGFREEDLKKFQANLETWRGTVSADLDPIHKEIAETQQGVTLLKGHATEMTKKITEIGNNISNKKGEYESLTKDTGKNKEKIDRLELNENKRTQDIKELPKDLERFEKIYEPLRKTLEQAWEQHTGSPPPVGVLIDALADKYLGFKLSSMVSGSTGPDAKALETQANEVLRDIKDTRKKLEKAQADQRELEDLRKQKKDLPNEIKKLEEEKTKSEEEKSITETQILGGYTHLGDLIRRFGLYEERLTHSLDTDLISSLLKSVNNRKGEHAVNLIEKSMTSVEEDRKQKLREFLTNRWISREEVDTKKTRRALGKTAGKVADYLADVSVGVFYPLQPDRIQKWIDERIDGKKYTEKYEDKIIKKDYKERLLNPGDDYKNIDEVLKNAFPTQWNEIYKDETQLQQLRAAYAIELRSTYHKAFEGATESLLERQIMATQPWFREVVKIGPTNPEFAEHLQEAAPDVTVEAIQNGEAGAISKVQNVSPDHPLLFDLLMGGAGVFSLVKESKENEQTTH